MIDAQGLTKEFKGVRVVDGLDLSVSPGELFGLIGPDGAGKTTTLRLLAGLLDLSDGAATIAGFDLRSQAESIKPLIGYMAQEFSLYGELSVVENLRFFAELYGVAPAEIDARMIQLLEFAGLTDFRDRRGAHLSGGMRKKLVLSATLIHRPQLLLLDEPTTGVDPISRREFWDILNELHLDGTTILVSTPYMDEADRCSRVALMHAGRLIALDSPAAIRARIPGELLELKTHAWRRAIEALRGLPGVLEIQQYGESLHLLVDSARKRSRSVKRALRRAQVDYHGLRSAPIRMEEAFLSLMRSSP
jgi:ABC-2 type transport system ATP-binding protein